MQLQHRFTVPASIDVVWETLNDLESVVGCFPGATLSSVDGDEFSGTCKVKLGPGALQYTGSGRFLQRDVGEHRAVIDAKGKDKRGNGTAAATITTQLASEGDEFTAVTVDTDLNITGRPAQFGRGMMQDVSDKLLGQFATCLESKLTGGAEEATTAESAARVDSAAAESASPASEPSSATAGASSAASQASSAAPGPSSTARESSRSGRSALPSSSEALDLGAAVIPVVLRRYGPYLLGAVGVLLLVGVVRRRRRRRAARPAE